MKQKHLPALGQRIVRSAVAVFICIILYDLMDADTMPFQASLVALLCIQPYKSQSRDEAFWRVIGILLGAICGTAIYLIWVEVLSPMNAGTFIQAILISLGILLMLYLSVLLHQAQAASYSCVIYLGIAMQFSITDDPISYVGGQLAATFAGIVVGLIVNAFHLPRRKQKDTLFLVDLEKMLPDDNGQVTGYSRVVMSNMIEDGLKLSFTTVKTPGSFLESLKGISINQPVIVMNGVAIYDPTRHVFLEKQELLHEDAIFMRNVLRELGTDSMQAVISGNSVLMFYQELTAGEKLLYEATKGSPYRNYISHELPFDMDVAYLLVLDDSEKVGKIKEELEQMEEINRFRLYSYDSYDFSGCSYLKIYHKDAKPENLLDSLQRETGFSEIQIVGEEERGEQVVRALKAAYEPPIWRKN